MDYCYGARRLFNATESNASVRFTATLPPTPSKKVKVRMARKTTTTNRLGLKSLSGVYVSANFCFFDGLCAAVGFCVCFVCVSPLRVCVWRRGGGGGFTVATAK